MSSNSYIFVYQTICEVNNKSYIGVHKTENIDDGYIGCGVYSRSDAEFSKRPLFFHRAVKKHGYNSFRRYILSFYDTYEEALEEEKYLVDEEWVKNKNNYNTAVGGRGSTTKWMSEEEKTRWKNNIKEKVNNWVKNGGKEILLKNIQKINLNPPKRKKGYKVPSTWRKVEQYDKEGNFIKLHNSVREAAKSVKTTPGNVVSCCKGDYKNCMGFVFRYTDYSEEERSYLQEKLSKFVEGKNKLKK
jgi:hypothetical protein